jgi:hypothetical protein
MRKNQILGDETFNGLNNRQTAAIILTLVIGLPSRSPGSIKLHDRGLTSPAYIPLPPKLRNLSDVPPHYIHNRREFAVKSCLRELFGERMKDGRDSGDIVRMRKKRRFCEPVSMLASRGTHQTTDAIGCVARNAFQLKNSRSGSE